MKERPDPVAPETLRRRLEELAAQAHTRSTELAAELDRRRGLPAGPGDLFVLPATADLPVEWAILDRGTGGKLLAVPADSGLPAGTADVEVPAGAPGGPLSLRCRYGAWLDGALFEPDLRSGALAPETVAEALNRIQQIETGTLAGSPLAEEVDADPEYADWIRDVPERARELASAARATTPRPSPARFRGAGSWGAVHRLAAVLALVIVGQAIWIGLLLREVEQLSVPIVDPPAVVLGEDVRGGAVLAVPREASHVRLILDVDFSIKSQDGYLEIADRTGQPIWRSPQVRLTPGRKLDVVVPRTLLPYGDYRIRVLPDSGSDARPLDEETLRIEPAE